MNVRATSILLSVLLLIFVSADVKAEQRMIAGSERGSDLVATGASDALTSPARVVSEIAKETKEFGVFGLVGGPVRGTLKAGTQALRGGARMAIGILDVLTPPYGNTEPQNRR